MCGIHREWLFSKVWAVKRYLQKKTILQNWRTYWLLILDYRLRYDWHYTMIIHASSYFLRVGICILFLYFVSVFLYLIQSLENSWLEIWLWILCTSVYFDEGAHRSTGRYEQAPEEITYSRSRAKRASNGFVTTSTNILFITISVDDDSGI